MSEAAGAYRPGANTRIERRAVFNGLLVGRMIACPRSVALANMSPRASAIDNHIWPVCSAILHFAAKVHDPKSVCTRG